MKSKKNPMFFHARNTNMETSQTTQLSHSSSESLKSATMIQLFPQKSLFSIKSLVQCLAREGVGRFCGIGHFFIPIREPCVLSIPSGGIFPHFLDIYFWSGILFGCQKTQIWFIHFLKPGFSDFTFVLSPAFFCVLLFVYCLLLGSIPLFDVPVLFVFSHGWG